MAAFGICLVKGGGAFVFHNTSCFINLSWIMRIVKLNVIVVYPLPYNINGEKMLKYEIID
jgi:hypothetical protein